MKFAVRHTHLGGEKSGGSTQAAEFTEGENVSCPTSHKGDTLRPCGFQLMERDRTWGTSLVFYCRSSQVDSCAVS